MYPHHLLSGMKSRNKRKEVGILGRIFLTIKMLRFGSIPSSFQEILPRKCSKKVFTDKDHMTPFLDFDDVIKSFNQSFYDPSLFCFDFD